MTKQDKEILVFDNMERIADYLIDQWTRLSYNAIEEKGYFSVALSGGTTPLTLYRKLSERKSLPWNRTHVFMVDERFVPYDSEENNYHMINMALLCHVVVPANNIHFISTTENTPEDSARRYEDDLISYSKKTKSLLPSLDMVLLGIGDDGHTASLFPGATALAEVNHLAVAVTAPDAPVHERITLTYPVINNAGNIFFLATGDSKAKIIKKIIENQNSQLPAALVRPENGNLFYMLDKGSAYLLSGAFLNAGGHHVKS